MNFKLFRSVAAFVLNYPVKINTGVFLHDSKTLATAAIFFTKVRYLKISFLFKHVRTITAATKLLVWQPVALHKFRLQ